MGLDRVGIHDNFFNMGGHSLLALRVIDQIQTKFGSKVPLVKLFEAPTISEMIKVLEVESTDRLPGEIIPFRATGSRPPFFLIADHGGFAFRFRYLTKYLDSDKPFYGMQLPGLEGRQEPFENFEELCAHLLHQIRKVQPEGPYHLGGHCYGGTVAYEIAQQLLAMGEEVAFLGLFDSHARSTKARPLIQRIMIHTKIFRKMSKSERRKYLRDRLQRLKGRIKRPVETSGAVGHIDEDVELPEAATIGRVQRAARAAIRKYQKKPYPGRVTVFRVEHLFNFIEPLCGWDNFVEGGVELRPIGCLVGQMFFEPHVRILGKELTECLRSAKS
jgi:thioesterase domain-containing protein